MSVADDRQRLILRYLPSSLVLFFAVLFVLGSRLALAKGLADPDYFWHLATGKLISESGTIPSTDPFSFTWMGKPWVLHEWLSELLVFRLVQSIGPFPALGVFGLLVPAGLASVAIAFRRRGVPAMAIVVATLLAAAVAMPYATVRPQVLSWLLICVLLTVLISLRPGRQGVVMLLTPLFALWANLHGLWVVGLGVVALYTLASFLGRTPMSVHRGWVSAGAAGCLMATAATPAGVAGILYPLRYVDAGDWGLAHIPEWQSPNFHDAVQLPLLAWIIVVALVSRTAPGWLRVLAVVGILMALVANRNAPVAAMLGVPAVAFGIGRLVGERARPTGQTVGTAIGRRIAEAAIAMVTILTIQVAIPPVYGSSGVVLDRYPVAAMDILTTRLPDARVFAEYGWGGYVIYRIHDSGGSVFVDGRNDMYDQSILEKYSAIRAAQVGWEGVLDRYRVDAVILPPDAPLTRVLAASGAWCEAFRDGRQVLALRNCSVAEAFAEPLAATRPVA
jgi:hypothetical protein